MTNRIGTNVAAVVPCGEHAPRGDRQTTRTLTFKSMYFYPDLMPNSQHCIMVDNHCTVKRIIYCFRIKPNSQYRALYVLAIRDSSPCLRICNKNNLGNALRRYRKTDYGVVSTAPVSRLAQQVLGG